MIAGGIWTTKCPGLNSEAALAQGSFFFSWEAHAEEQQQAQKRSIFSSIFSAPLVTTNTLLTGQLVPF